MSAPENRREYIVDVLLDSIHWCVWAEAERSDVADIVDRMEEATCWDSAAIVMVAVPRGITASEVQGLVDKEFGVCTKEQEA